MEATRLDLNVYTLKAEIVEENNNSRVLEKTVLFSCEHIYFDKQLLLQITIYCGEVMENNEMTSLMTQSLLDACSI